MIKFRDKYSGFREEKGTVLGVIFGCADDPSEKDLGIEGLVKDFGIDRENYLGFEARRVRQIPKNLIIYGSKAHDAVVLAYHPNMRMRDIDNYLNFPMKKPLETAWDSNYFVIRMARKPMASNMPGGEELLTQLHSSMLRQNAIIMLKSNPEVRGPQLMILDNRIIPNDIKKRCLDNDTAQQERYDAKETKYKSYSISF
jgi:hypothetical protein